MRKFIYLDIDTLNSYLAQIFNGLPQNQETETSKGRKKERQNRFFGNLGGQIAFKLFNKGVDATAEATYEHLKTIADDEMIKDVQTKIMHDNAFSEFATHIQDHALLGKNGIGDFVAIEDNFYIFDIAFYQKLFSENGFIDGLQEIQEYNINKTAEHKVQGLNRDLRRNKNVQNQVKITVDEAIDESQEEFLMAEKMLNLLASIIPYPQIMCISNYLVVLNEKYLRDDLSTAAFKYGGKIKVVGYITNKVMAQNSTSISAFAGIGESINAIMKIFFEKADEMYIVHPVAIYYDT